MGFLKVFLEGGGRVLRIVNDVRRKMSVIQRIQGDVRRKYGWFKEKMPWFVE